MLALASLQSASTEWSATATPGGCARSASARRWAPTARVVRLLVAGGLKLTVIGGARGLALAVVATRLLGGLPFEMEVLDPLTFPACRLLLGVAAYLPVRGTSRVHPATALSDRLSAGRATTDSEPCSKQRYFDGLGRAASAQVWRMNGPPASRSSLASHAQAKRLKPLPKTASAPNATGRATTTAHAD